MGLNQVVSAVSFLNNDCKLIHGNICTAAVVVTDALDWKLHGFDLVTEHEWPNALGADVPLAAASWMVGPQYKAGEVAKGDWQAVREGPGWAVDAWGLGCLIQEVYSGSLLTKTEDLRSTDRILPSVLPYYQRLLSSAAPRRLNPSKLLESGVLKSKLGETMAFLENLAIKDAIERDTFFKRLPATLPSIPTPVAQRKLLPLLASALEFGGAPPSALGTLLAIGEGMSEEDRARQVLPILTKLFASNDRGIRRGLLENIASYGHALPTSLVEEQIYPHVQTGFADANPYLRELTLKSMVQLGPKLSQKTLNQSLLKHLAKLQVDEEPAIRANTTVLLGNLADQLPESTCRKVLLNAFTRALKDPFPPARAAGLRAVLATAKHYGAEEVAGRVVPMVGPLCIDPIQEVRSSALQCLEHFMGTLKEHGEELDRKAAASASGDGVTAIGSSGGGGGGGSSLLTGFGWAVSSLVSKNTDGQAAAAAAALPPPPASINNGGPIASTTIPRPTPPTATTKTTREVHDEGWDDGQGGGGGGESTNTSANDGWEDDDDPLEDMMDAAAAEMEARKRLSRVTMGSSSGSRGGRSGGTGATVAVGGRKPMAARTTGGSRASLAGKGMKLGAKKIQEDDFDTW